MKRGARELVGLVTLSLLLSTGAVIGDQRRIRMLGGASRILSAGLQHSPWHPPSSTGWPVVVETRPWNFEERSRPLAGELLEAILRIEGFLDPTRVGAFGPSLRMRIRAGTASSTDVYGSSWRRMSLNPNAHFRLRYFAYGWLRYGPRNCADYREFRPQDDLVIIDAVDTLTCMEIGKSRKSVEEKLSLGAISVVPLSLPVFASPFPGNRYSPRQLSEVLRRIAMAKTQGRIVRWRPHYHAAKAF